MDYLQRETLRKKQKDYQQSAHSLPPKSPPPYHLDSKYLGFPNPPLNPRVIEIYSNTPNLNFEQQIWIWIYEIDSDLNSIFEDVEIHPDFAEQNSSNFRVERYSPRVGMNRKPWFNPELPVVAAERTC